MIRTIMIVISIAIAFTWASQSDQEQEHVRKVLVISSDLNVPYDIYNGIKHVKTVTSTFKGNAFDKAVGEAIKEVTELIQQSGYDALINTSVQIAIYPAKTPSGEMGQVVIFGTLVKYK